MRTYSTTPILAACTLAAACLDPQAERDSPAFEASHAAYSLAGSGVEYTARHYEVSFDLDSHAMNVAVHLEIESAGPCLTIPTRVQPLDITLDDQSVALDSVQANRLTVCEPTGGEFSVGERVVVAVRSEQAVGPQGEADVGFTVNAEGIATYSYLLSWVEGCDLFGPCDTRPDRFATYHFTVQHAPETEVLCPGMITTKPAAQAPGAQPKLVTECRFDYPGGPTYSTFGLIARSAPWHKRSYNSWPGVDATLYFESAELEAAFTSSELEPAFQWFLRELGPFPYGKELRFIEAPTQWGGFEHPGNIVLKAGLSNRSDYYPSTLKHTVLHELAHQWAGNHTTLRTANDFAWKEAAAEYLTFLYETDRKNYKATSDLASYWKYWGLEAKRYPVPTEDVPLESFYSEAYGAGTMTIFRQIGAMFGDAAVKSALQSLVETREQTSERKREPRPLSIDEVRAALETATGAQLGEYVDEWVRGQGEPASLIVEPTLDQLSDGSWSVRLTGWSEDMVERGCAFHVSLIGLDGNRADYAFNNGPDGGEFPTPPPQHLSFEPTSFEVDPYSECLVEAEGMPAQRWTGSGPVIM